MSDDDPKDVLIAAYLVEELKAGLAEAQAGMAARGITPRAATPWAGC
jgi:hypothetical protein